MCQNYKNPSATGLQNINPKTWYDYLHDIILFAGCQFAIISRGCFVMNCTPKVFCLTFGVQFININYDTASLMVFSCQNQRTYAKS